MGSLELITRVGPTTSRPATGPATSVPFRIEVEMGSEPEILSLSAGAAAELHIALGQWLEMYRVR
jgi:hypothetical protein